MMLFFLHLEQMGFHAQLCEISDLGFFVFFIGLTSLGFDYTLV